VDKPVKGRWLRMNSDLRRWLTAEINYIDLYFGEVSISRNICFIRAYQYKAEAGRFLG
jgi:hypothetical protein